MAKQSEKETVIKRRKLVDQETGEELETTEILQTGEMKDRDFEKLFAGHMAMVTGVFGYAKMKVFTWLIRNRDRRNNRIIASQKEIAEGANVGTTTVAETISDLIEADALIKEKKAVYCLNPDLVFYGGPQKRMNVLYRYKNTKSEQTGKDEYKQNNIEYPDNSENVVINDKEPQMA